MPSYPGGVGLMIGIPHDGKPVTFAYCMSYSGMHPPMNYDCRLTIVQGKPVDQARNEIAQSAIDAKCKYLFFNDTDVTIPAWSIRQLIWHLEHFDGTQTVGPDKEGKVYAVAGGIYTHKSPPQMPMVFRGNGIGPYMDWKVGEVFECSGIGMGCTLIRVDVLAKLEKPWFKTVDDVEEYKDGTNKATMWTEDLWFCKRVTDAGYGVLADGGLLCDHWDTMSNTPYRMPPHAKPFRRTATHGKKIVDLGSGTVDQSYRTEEGSVLRVDIREDVKPDYRCDIRQTPFGTGEFDVVFSSNTLEHLSIPDMHQAMEEMKRILKPAGELRLVLPNLEWAARNILNGEITPLTMEVLYGKQDYKENTHKTGFTSKMIEQVLKGYGFKKFVWDFNNFQMMCRAWLDENAEPTILNPVVTEVNKTPTNGTGKKRKGVDIVLKQGKETKILHSPPNAKAIRAKIVAQK